MFFCQVWYIRNVSGLKVSTKHLIMASANTLFLYLVPRKKQFLTNILLRLFFAQQCLNVELEKVNYNKCGCNEELLICSVMSLPQI